METAELYADALTVEASPRSLQGFAARHGMHRAMLRASVACGSLGAAAGVAGERLRAAFAAIDSGVSR